METENIEQFEQEIQNHDFVLAYFSNEACNVCKVLKPKVFEMINTSFPKIKLVDINTVVSPEVASQQMVFTIPTILVYAMGKETIRKSRNVGVEELKSLIDRLYQQVFENN